MQQHSLSGLLNEDNVIFNLKASSKEEVLDILTKKAIEAKFIKRDDEKYIYDRLLEREESMSTGIGSGVAIPHCSVDIVDDLKCVMAICKEGIDFDAIDDEPVNIFILLLIPRNTFQNHIRTLAMIARTLNREAERNMIINSSKHDEITKVLTSIQYSF